MGNRALSAALQIISNDEANNEIFKEIYFQNTLLMAADEGDDALSNNRKMRLLLDISYNIDIYVSQSDVAMGLSWGTNLRKALGYSGPPALSELPTKVRVIDCTRVGKLAGSDFAGHQYYQRSNIVIEDATQVLAGVDPCKIQPRVTDTGCNSRSFVIPSPN